MDRMSQGPDGSYHWDCSIDIEYHRKTGRKGLLGILVLCAFVFVLFLAISHGEDFRNDIWIPLLVIGVILVIALPLIFLWNSAGDPHERYEMTEEYVKSGYGKSSIYSQFRKIKEVLVTPRYIEMSGDCKTNRIYVPAEDMDFVREFILERIPDDALIRHG